MNGNNKDNRSKLSMEFDKMFKINELNYVESNTDHSYIEVRQFPFNLDGTYNEKYFVNTANMTIEDMQALISRNLIFESRIDSNLANKLGY